MNKMDEVRISVAVTTYNGENYIKAQMDSILANLAACDEVVVSDDGSTDATLAILKEYEDRQISVRVIRGPGEGILKNIGEVLQACRGRYIFLADQDDIWMKHKVETVMEQLGRDGCRLVCHDARVMDGSLQKVLMPSFFAYRGSRPGFLPNLVKNRYMGCCMAFERELLAYVLPIPQEIEMHDQWIGMINDLRGGKSLFIPDRLLIYRRHDKNVSDFSHGTVWEMIQKRLRLLRAILRRRQDWE